MIAISILQRVVMFFRLLILGLVTNAPHSNPRSSSLDVRFARGLLRQFQEYANPSPPLPGRPLGNGTGIEPSSLLEALFLSSSSEDEDDRDNHRSRSRNQRTNTVSSEQTRHQIIQQFVSFISNRMRDHDAEREPDHMRAHAVIDGLEPVSRDLLSRYEVVRGEDHPQRRAPCAVCYEPLDLDSSYNIEDDDPVEPIQTENKELSLVLPYHAAFPEVVAFPCLHLFHSECLLPWLARKTTCPTCRFDVDPDSLTLKGGSTQRPWVPPVDGVLEAWVGAEETKKFSRVKDGLLFPLPNTIAHIHLNAVPLTLGSEDRHSSDLDIPSLSSGYETDESASSVGSFRTCYEGENRFL
ncbi:hypothetical protein BDM02DRAFT_1278660 [Thelephora ganbajun]|uniref:Uncharacterized protein n=1 Tax=Thelephora ganbajun TaxID=370292 RepID=A0ACB6Z3E8_THEGA|nr:hypothetical protein BDM02DRAFT_1278660 [Thelephora ganbajun]